MLFGLLAGRTTMHAEAAVRTATAMIPSPSPPSGRGNTGNTHLRPMGGLVGLQREEGVIAVTTTVCLSAGRSGPRAGLSFWSSSVCLVLSKRYMFISGFFSVVSKVCVVLK